MQSNFIFIFLVHHLTPSCNVFWLPWMRVFVEFESMLEFSFGLGGVCLLSQKKKKKSMLEFLEDRVQTIKKSLQTIQPNCRLSTVCSLRTGALLFSCWLISEVEHNYRLLTGGPGNYCGMNSDCTYRAAVS